MDVFSENAEQRSTAAKNIRSKCASLAQQMRDYLMFW